MNRPDRPPPAAPNPRLAYRNEEFLESDEARPLANAGDDALPSLDEIEQFKTKHGIK